MNGTLLIKSSPGRTELEFSELQADTLKRNAEYLQVSLRDYGVTATSQVYIYNRDFSLPEFFASMVTEPCGWKGEKRWESTDGELLLAAIFGIYGEVELRVTLSAEPHPDAWVTQAVLHIETDQLAELASRVQKFFSYFSGENGY